MITEKMQIARYARHARAWGKVGDMRWEVEAFDDGSTKIRTNDGSGFGWERGVPRKAPQELREEIDKGLDAVRWKEPKKCDRRYVGGCAPYVGPAFHDGCEGTGVK